MFLYLTICKKGALLRPVEDGPPIPFIISFLRSTRIMASFHGLMTHWHMVLSDALL